ncbi:MAG: VOC family protein [Candidatus Riflebacteria bacterium]|nr:VOC family protein [Candidatus Riflebacteria bacterium]
MISFRHVGIVVENMKKSLEFYQNLLGFTIKKDTNEDTCFIEKILGKHFQSLHTVKLSFPVGDGLLELLEFIPVSNDKYLGGKVSTRGISHFALTVCDVDQFYNQLLTKKVHFISSPKKSPDGKAKVAFCLDPDGNPIELVEEIN